MLLIYILLISHCQINTSPYISQPILVKCHLNISLSVAEIHLWTTEDMQTQEIFWVVSKNPPCCPIICCLSKISTESSSSPFQSTYQYSYPSLHKLIWGWDFARDSKALLKSNYNASATSLTNFKILCNKRQIKWAWKDLFFTNQAVYCSWLSFRKIN